MPSVKEIVAHLRQVYSSRGGKMTIYILLISGGVLGGIFIGLSNHTIPPLSGIWSPIVATIGFIFSFAFIAAILLLLSPTRITTKQRGAVTTLKTAGTKGTVHEERGGYKNLLDIWARRLGLGGMILILLIIYSLGWFFVIKNLISPTFQQIKDNPIIWTTDMMPSSITTIGLNIMLITMWIIMPFIAYLDIQKKQHRRTRGKDKKEEQL